MRGHKRSVFNKWNMTNKAKKNMLKKLKGIILITWIVSLANHGYSANPESDFDICVYGESASGVIAAIQGARLGKKVVLVSKNEHVGGLATSGLTATDMNRNDMVGGLAKEFYQR